MKLNISGIFSDAFGSSCYKFKNMDELSQICVLCHAFFFFLGVAHLKKKHIHLVLSLGYSRPRHIKL